MTVLAVVAMGQKKGNSNAQLEKQVIGKHMLSLQWISWEKFGTCEIT